MLGSMTSLHLMYSYTGAEPYLADATKAVLPLISDTTLGV